MANLKILKRHSTFKFLKIQWVWKGFWLQHWLVRDPKSKHSNRLGTNLDNSSESKPEFEAKQWVERNLNQGRLTTYRYPPRTIELSYFNILNIENVTHKFNQKLKLMVDWKPNLKFYILTNKFSETSEIRWITLIQNKW